MIFVSAGESKSISLTTQNSKGGLMDTGDVVEQRLLYCLFLVRVHKDAHALHKHEGLQIHISTHCRVVVVICRNAP